MYKTYYLNYPYSYRNFTAVFLRYRWLHGTDTLPVTVRPYTVVYGYGAQPYLGMSWAGWQEGHLDDVLLFHNFNSKKSCDHVKRLTIEANHLKNLTVSKPNKSQE